MPALFTQHRIASALFSWWADQLPLEAATIYPGTQLDTAALAEWLELRIDHWAERPGRDGARRLIDLTVVVHCFVRPGPNAGRVHELADAARTTFARQTVPVWDTGPDPPLLGHVTLLETEVRNDPVPSGLQHLVLTCPGLAQQA